MPKAKQQKEILKFESNNPVQITLSTDPSSAKSNTRETQWGTKTSFTYFTKDDKVFFASEALHNKLLEYSKGDTIIVTLVDGKMWTLSISGERHVADAGLNKLVEDTETIVLLRSMYEDILSIKNHLNLNGTKEETRKYPTDNPAGSQSTGGDDLPF